MILQPWMGEKKIHFISWENIIHIKRVVNDYFRQKLVQIYFNMENTFNGQISILNLEMRNTTQSTKTFCTSQLTVAKLLYIERERKSLSSMLPLTFRLKC
jgi:hypothetical protein